jgi:thioredoxin 1
MVEEIKSKDEFEAALQSSEYVIAFFTATWCGPCRMMDTFFEELSDTLLYSSIKFTKVDIDANEEIASENSVSSLPVFIIYRNGKGMDELLGARKEKLEMFLKRYADR